MFFQYYEELELGNISRLRPFEETLRHGLHARFDTNNSYPTWREDCSLPLALDGESVLDRYFDDIIVERVSSKEQGWKILEDKALTLEVIQLNS